MSQPITHMPEFDRHTALEPLGDGSFAVELSPEWWVLRSLNGGYLAALAVRALTAALDDPARAPRSLTLHFPSPAREGAARVETRVERRGRAVTTLSLRMLQDDRLVLAGLAAFSPPWPAGRSFAHAEPPRLAAPEDLPPRPDEGVPASALRWDMRLGIGGAPHTGAREALAGGWLRLAEQRLADAPVVAAMTDAWFPATFPMLERPEAVPTIDLTIHFREALPAPGASPADWYAGVFRSRFAREGFVEEDGEIWSADGRLLAQSRQLAVLVGG